MSQTATRSHRKRRPTSKNRLYFQGLAEVDKEEHKASGSSSGWPTPA
jgi:hypothetical protein